MPNEPEPAFPVNLRAFCQLAVERLGYENISRVLDILDENFDVVQLEVRFEWLAVQEGVRT